jgi:hypothetical protein
MANEFDPYREALVVESTTVWPEQYDDLEPGFKQHVESSLHAHPQEAADMTYVRVHTGFCRQIAVTDADLDRLKLERAK